MTAPASALSSAVVSENGVSEPLIGASRQAAAPDSRPATPQREHVDPVDPDPEQPGHHRVAGRRAGRQPELGAGEEQVQPDRDGGSDQPSSTSWVAVSVEPATWIEPLPTGEGAASGSSP